jgi:hypothetical protein
MLGVSLNSEGDEPTSTLHSVRISCFSPARVLKFGAGA